MGIGIGTIVMADGAILAWAVDTSNAGLNAQIVGYTLVALGAVAVLLSLGRRGRSRAAHDASAGRKATSVR